MKSDRNKTFAMQIFILPCFGISCDRACPPLTATFPFPTQTSLWLNRNWKCNKVNWNIQTGSCYRVINYWTSAQCTYYKKICTKCMVLLTEEHLTLQLKKVEATPNVSCRKNWHFCCQHEKRFYQLKTQYANSPWVNVGGGIKNGGGGGRKLQIHKGKIGIYGMHLAKMGSSPTSCNCKKMFCSRMSLNHWRIKIYGVVWLQKWIIQFRIFSPKSQKAFLNMQLMFLCLWLQESIYISGTCS
jgi:hypothetical protein